MNQKCAYICVSFLLAADRKCVEDGVHAYCIAWRAHERPFPSRGRRKMEGTARPSVATVSFSLRCLLAPTLLLFNTPRYTFHTNHQTLPDSGLTPRAAKQ